MPYKFECELTLDALWNLLEPFYVACPLPVAKSNSLLSTANVDVLSKPSTEKPIQHAAWRK